jgi:hypothetical protein
MSATGSGPPTPTPSPAPPPPPTPAPTPPPTPPPTPAPADLGTGPGVSPLSPSPDGGDIGQAYITATDSSAAQLLSSTFPDGLSNAYNPDQGGWSAGAQLSDAYTAGAGAGNAFTGGSGADPFTAVAPGGGNQNGFTGGSDIDPYGGVQNSEPFTGGSPPAASGTPSSDLASLYGGPVSLLSSPDLLAANDVTTPAANAVASDASDTGFTPQVSDTGSDTGGSTYIGTIVDNGVTYYQFADIDGSVYEMRADTDTSPAPAPAGTPPTGGTGTYSPVPTPPDAPKDVPPPATPAPPPTPSPDPAPSAAAPPTTQPTAADPASPPPTPPATPPASPPDPAQSQQPQQAPPTASPSPSQAPAPVVPFDPMADSPLAKWLLYGNDTPVRDFLTNDNNLRTAQNVALGVSAAALTVAGGLALAGAASGAIATAGTVTQAGSLISAAVPLATAGAGLVAADPGLAEELEEGVEGVLPAAESELGVLADELESSLPSAGSGSGIGPGPTTEASALFQARDQAASTARQIVQQEINSGWISPERAQARFGTWLDALAKSNVRQAVAEGRLPGTFVTSPTVSLSRGYLGAWIKAPDVWDTATGRAWDFMASNQAAFYAHQASYVGETAFGRGDPGGTTITEIFPLFHAGFGGL